MPLAVGSKAPDFTLKQKTATGLVDISDRTVCPTVYFAWAADVACPAE